MIQPPLILASVSPRRKQLLSQIGLDFTIKPSRVHEDFSLNLPPEEFAPHYARLKAAEVAGTHPDHLVIGADTIVVLGDKILGKPANREESFAMLSSLSGKTHRVITGVSLQWHEKNLEDTFIEITRVTFKQLRQADIDYYIDNYAPFDKAGSYGIQDWFATCVARIEGCFYNVVGFPLAAFYDHYRSILDQ